MENFNPRSPRGERRIETATPDEIANLFQSTLPARGATRGLTGKPRLTLISIHSPREGSDKLVFVLIIVIADFNPRSPRGERHGQRGLLCKGEEFQSTLPARGATIPYNAERQGGVISIHAPREGSDTHRSRKKYANKIISIHAPREGSDAIIRYC